MWLLIQTEPLDLLTTGIVRSGKVSQGCLSILEELPIVNVAVEDLPGLVSNPGMLYHILSKCKLKSY